MSLRLTLLGGASLLDVAVPLIALICMALLFLAVAILLINQAERKAKVNATLTQF